MTKKKRLFELFALEESIGRSQYRSANIDSALCHFEKSLEYANQIEQMKNYFTEDETEFNDAFNEIKMNIGEMLISLKGIPNKAVEMSIKRIICNDEYMLKDSKISNFKKELDKLLQNYDKMKGKIRSERIETLCRMISAKDVDLNLLCKVILKSALIDSTNAKILAELCFHIHKHRTANGEKKIKGSFAFEMASACEELWKDCFKNKSESTTMHNTSMGIAFLSFISWLYCHELLDIKIIVLCLSDLCSRFKENSSEFYVNCISWLLNKSFLNAYMLNNLDKTKINETAITDVINIEKLISNLLSCCGQNNSENIKQVVKHLSTNYYECKKDIQQRFNDPIDWDANSSKDYLHVIPTTSSMVSNNIQVNSSLTSSSIQSTPIRQITNNFTVSDEDLSQIMNNRQKMITNVKSDPQYKYKAYIAKVSKFSRKQGIHPRTPNPKNYSENEWNIVYEEWKRKLKYQKL